MNRSQSILAAIVLILAPIDVIDLAGGAMSFRITPFLALSPVIAAYLLTGTIKDTFTLKSVRTLGSDHALILLCAVLIWLSTALVGPDPAGLALKRTLLFLWLLLFAVLFVERMSSNLGEAIIVAVKVYIVISLVSMSFQYLILVGTLHVSPLIERYLIDLTPGKVYGSITELIRFRGLVGDPNRSAVGLVLLLSLAYFVGSLTPSRNGLSLRWFVVGGALVVATVSRTGIASLLILGVIAFLRERKTRTWYAYVALAGLAGLLAVAIVLSSQDRTTAFSEFFLRTKSTSTSAHLNLLSHGLAVFLEDVKTVLIGKGWGTAYVYTESFFPANEYGNFHSAYATFAVQAGFGALLLYNLYIVRPLFKGHPFGAIAWVILWANVFYQYNAEALHWIVLVAMNSTHVRSYLQKSVQSPRGGT